MAVSADRPSFQDKQRLLGFPAGRVDAHGAAALAILGLVRPRAAYVFGRRHLDCLAIASIAEELEVDEPAVRDLLDGKDGALGAEDWLLVLFQLLGEADRVQPGCAQTVERCFGEAVPDAPGARPFRGGLLAGLVDALVAPHPRGLLGAAFPWRPGHDHRVGAPILGWPSLPPAEGPQHLLPGLVAALHGQVTPRALRHACLALADLADDDGATATVGSADRDEVQQPGAEARAILRALLDVLNSPGARVVAVTGAIPAEAQPAALRRASFLASIAPSRRLRCLAILAGAALDWDALVHAAGEPTLAGLAIDDRANACVVAGARAAEAGAP